MNRLNFSVQAKAAGSRARAATFRTLHGEVKTPLFMPVGTRASVSAQRPQTLEESGSQILLANTYHLLLRPGPEVFRKMGGIHRFMSWNGSVLTDSGGFQIFSLPHSRSMTEKGAVFQSYIDGTTILLSPELSIEMQKAIGSDIMMALDQCVPSTVDLATARAAMEITHRWAARSLAARGDSEQALFAIIQGALFKELRTESAAALAAMEFDGLAIGGLAVGESKSEREDLCEFTAGLMPEDKPRYLMGVGTPLDILEAVYRGVDMFDCIIPTQVAQRGGVFTSKGFVQLRRTAYKFAEEPVDAACSCPTCQRYSRAYLHHLTKSKETLGWQLLGKHNIYFYHQLMREVRASILEGRFEHLYREKRAILEAYDTEDADRPPPPKPPRPLRLGDYEIHTAREGFSSILHVSSGEIMHSRTPPMEEARRLYIEQSNLSERVHLSVSEEPLIIWDVGLGAAANAMGAIRTYEEEAEKTELRPMQIISFENDLDSLRLAFKHDIKFPYLRHGGPAGILKEGRWQSKKHPGLSWILVEGNFIEALGQEHLPPEVIFYDMFSSKTHLEHWTLAAFRKLYGACRGHGAELFTYTTSTAARGAMLAAGFYVARGRSTGDKVETTIAFTPEALRNGFARRHDLLGAEWLGRRSRSGAKFPAWLAEEEREGYDRAIVEHPQFNGGGLQG